MGGRARPTEFPPYHMKFNKSWSREVVGLTVWFHVGPAHLKYRLASSRYTLSVTARAEQLTPTHWEDACATNLTKS